MEHSFSWICFFLSWESEGPSTANTTPTKNTRPDHGLLTIIILDLFFGADVSFFKLVNESAQSYNIDLINKYIYLYIDVYIYIYIYIRLIYDMTEPKTDFPRRDGTL